MSRRVATVLAAFAIYTGVARQNQPGNSQTVLRSTSQEVLLDFIARDKHQKLVTDLRAEDIEVLKEAGASWIHLGLTDALFRRVGHSAKDPAGTGRAAYPTYRFDAARGRVASSDASLATEVGDMIREAAAANLARLREPTEPLSQRGIRRVLPRAPGPR